MKICNPFLQCILLSRFSEFSRHKHNMVIGILLPDSTTHPLISHDVLAGFKSAVKWHAIEGVELALGYIGFGTSVEVLKKETEKLILERDADIIIAFADHPIIDTIFPLISQLNKMLLVINNGAKYAIDWKASRNVYYHTLENCFCSFLTAGYAYSKTGRAAMATSYFDGGYSLCHAITQPFMDVGGEMMYNFAGSYKLNEFNIQPLVTFLQENIDTDSIFTILSGNLLTEYYKQLNQLIPHLTLDMYSHPVVLEETLAEHADLFPGKCNLTGFTIWYERVPGVENETFCNLIKEVTRRRPTSFSALGWDTALIVQQIIAITENNPARLSDLEACNIPAIEGVKGRIIPDEKTHHFLGDVYRLNYSTEGGLVSDATISAEESMTPLDKMVSQKIEGIASGWLNTYLCS